MTVTPSMLQTVVGGTNINSDVNKIRRRVPDILVATPGRLLDLLQTQGLRQHVSQLSVLVLDEADRLLDMGFR
jgi:superfamily II DNA/RNA helicase